MLEKFPTEIFHMVVEPLPKADLKSLSLVSVDIRWKVDSYLWGSITIRPRKETKLHDITTALTCPTSCIHRASGFRFVAPFQNVGDNRCPHFHSNSYTHWSGTELVERFPFEELSSCARSFLDKFKEDRLRSFSWDMGCCVPESILGENGLLARMHPSLKSLRLITDPTCYPYGLKEPRDHGRVDLSSFRKLKSICWTGSSNRDHQALSAVIKNNAHHLDNLELNLLSWRDGFGVGAHNFSHKGHDDNAGYFGNTLGLHQHTPQPMFRFLTSLVLAGAPLGPAMVDMINFEVLRSLTLRLCPHWPTFTQRIVEIGLPVKLKTFELHQDLSIPTQTTQAEVDPFDRHYIRQSDVESFIDVCEGLEQLFLNLPKPSDAWSLWQHIARHRASLKRLTVHHTTRYHNEVLLYGQQVDLPNLGLTEHEDRLYHPRFHNPLAGLKLDCISLCCFPDLAELMLETSSSLPSLRLIHIRQTGRDLHVFDSMAVDRGSRLMDRYELNNQGNRYFDYWYCSYFATHSCAREPLEPLTPCLIKLQDAFESLAQWAFGPDGPPLLEAIAYGDFAHGGRANVDNLILYRHPEGFQLLLKDDPEWMNIVEKYRNVLEACPTMPLFMGSEAYYWENDEQWMAGYRSYD